MKFFNFYKEYENLSALERADIICLKYSNFAGVINEFKQKLIYDIHAEEEYSRSHNRADLGVRIQRLGNYQNPTEDQAISNHMTEKSVDSKGDLYIGCQISEEALERFERKKYVLEVMVDEYNIFRAALDNLEEKDREIYRAIITHSKSYAEVAMMQGITVETVRKAFSVFRNDFIEYVANGFRPEI